MSSIEGSMVVPGLSTCFAGRFSGGFPCRVPVGYLVRFPRDFIGSSRSHPSFLADTSERTQRCSFGTGAPGGFPDGFRANVVMCVS